MQYLIRPILTARCLARARLFHVSCSPAIAPDSMPQATALHAAPDRRLEIFLDQQRQQHSAVTQLQSSIIVTVVPPGGLAVPTSFKFDSSSPPPTPAHILSLLPDSSKYSPGSSHSDSNGALTPIAAAANGQVIGLGRSAHVYCLAHFSTFSVGDVLDKTCRCLIRRWDVLSHVDDSFLFVNY